MSISDSFLTLRQCLQTCFLLVVFLQPLTVWGFHQFAFPVQKYTYSSSGTSIASPKQLLTPRSIDTTLSMRLSKCKTVIFDGAEMAAISKFTSPPGSQQIGFLKIVTGTIGDKSSGRRIVGVETQPSSDGSDSLVQLGSNTYVDPNSLAYIPDKISDDDAISTLAASLVGVHCIIPRVSDVGGAGSEGADFISGKAVVMGGGDFAVFSARGMATLGADVTLVSDTRPNIKNKGTENQVKVMTPGGSDEGFASAIGEFDSLLDTLNDEGQLGGSDDNADDDFLGGSTVVRLLKTQHKCHRYISTFSQSQKIVRDEGVLFGPRQANSYEEEITKLVLTSPARLRKIISPNDFGPKTVQKLLEAGVVYPAGKNKGKDVIFRGWSLKDFWEQTKWPRDSSGTGNVRFGLPVVEEVDIPISFYEEEQEEEEEEEKPKVSSKSAKKVQGSPFVMNVEGVEGLNENIVGSKKDYVLFLSATWCRACRSLTPQFNRMARINTEEPSGGRELVFAKAETDGTVGKELGRALEVDSVPTFILFRDGKRYGTPISLSRIPSKKLDKAVEYLISEREWDVSEFREE